MDKFITNTLPQLLLISKIPREGKLTVKNGELDIYGGGLWNWTVRACTGEGKKATVIYLKDFYQNIRKAVREMVKQNDKEDDIIVKKIRSNNLHAIIENLYLSLEGLNNLAGTYHDYPKTISDLEYIENHVVIPTIKFYIDSRETVPETEVIRRIKDDINITGKKKKSLLISPNTPRSRRGSFPLDEEAAKNLQTLQQITD